MKASRKYRMMVAWLRRAFPLAKPVSVRCRTGEVMPLLGSRHVLASCELLGEKFLIRIDRKQCYELRMDALIHEWAHAMTWFGAESPWFGANPQANEHGAEWGIAYAKLYSGFEEWDHGRETDEEE